MQTSLQTSRLARGASFFAAALLAGTALAQPSTVALEAAAPLAPVPAADTFALRAKVVHVGDGNVIQNGVVTVKDGKITAVGTSAATGVRVVDVDGHIAPGFIALRDATGAGSESNETARKLTPTADMSRAFDPEHPDWARVLDQGITTVVLTPDSSRVAGGVAAIVSPALGKVVRRGALVSLGMSERSLSTSVAPTSYAGLYAMLEAEFEAADQNSPLGAAAAGKTPVIMEALSRAEVLHAAAFAKKHGLKGALLGAPRASDTVDAIKGAGLAVIFEPLAAGDDPHAITSALALEKAGVPFAFTADADEAGPASMRMTVAAFLRGGLQPATALAAMAKNAAQIAGVSATHGTIAEGKVADLVVWSGDPTELTSRVLHVYGGGALVHDNTRKDGPQR